MVTLAALAARYDAGSSLYVTPVAFATGDAARALADAGEAVSLAGGPGAFTAAEVALRRDGHVDTAIASVAAIARLAAGGDAAGAALHRWLTALSAEPPAFAGRGGPQVMGIVNVTPDSFSDGGDRFDPDAAVAAGEAMTAAGAALVDVGGESTRPGSVPVGEAEELRRVIPVVTRLARAGVAVSVDTSRAAVMRAAVDAGAAVVNDVTALRDPAAMATVIDRAVPVVLMHMQGEPRTMQRDPSYVSAPHDIFDFLADRVAVLRRAGVPSSRIAVDPGIGFGKTIAHNLAILRALAVYAALGVPLLVGVSRKGFIGRLGGGAAPKDRLGGSLAGALWALARGASILRVHDVAETVRAVALWRALEEGASP
ncbi:MAG: dihydropteroate synthase [Alphaproteobacteria bacterium]|nr:dihydropteroate synthase [Alphaproteobacteria bacterium]